MQGHRQRQASKRCTTTPVRPKGYGGTGSSTVLALLDNVQTFPASRRLVSDPAAPVTRPHLLLGQAPRLFFRLDSPDGLNDHRLAWDVTAAGLHGSDLV